MGVEQKDKTALSGEAGKAFFPALLLLYGALKIFCL